MISWSLLLACAGATVDSMALDRWLEGSIRHERLDTLRPLDAAAFGLGDSGEGPAGLASWIRLARAMIRHESAFDGSTVYRERFPARDGRPQVSAGLFQLSLDDTALYGCRFPDSASLHDDSLNVACGIRILTRWVRRDGKISGQEDGRWRGGARYWAVLRPPVVDKIRREVGRPGTAVPIDADAQGLSTPEPSLLAVTR